MINENKENNSKYLNIVVMLRVLTPQCLFWSIPNTLFILCIFKNSIYFFECDVWFSSLFQISLLYFVPFLKKIFLVTDSFISRNNSKTVKKTFYFFKLRLFLNVIIYFCYQCSVTFSLNQYYNNEIVIKSSYFILFKNLWIVEILISV